MNSTTDLFATPKLEAITKNNGLDTTKFKQALSRFATGVTVITAKKLDGSNPDEWGHQFVGLTASSFNSLSLNPHLIVWSLGVNSRTVPSFQKASHYIINVLSDSQMSLCQQFAYSKGNRFKDVDFELSASGIPILKNSLAWFECQNRSKYLEGDHIIFVGEVLACGYINSPPLIHHQGGFHGIGGHLQSPSEVIHS